MWVRGLPQVVESLPSKCGALSLRPNTEKNKTQKGNNKVILFYCLNFYTQTLIYYESCSYFIFAKIQYYFELILI
jgi:hypothetical protein